MRRPQVKAQLTVEQLETRLVPCNIVEPVENPPDPGNTFVIDDTSPAQLFLDGGLSENEWTELLAALDAALAAAEAEMLALPLPAVPPELEAIAYSGSFEELLVEEAPLPDWALALLEAGPTADEIVANAQAYVGQRAGELAQLETQLTLARAARYDAVLRGIQPHLTAQWFPVIAKLEGQTERASFDLGDLQAVLSRLPPTAGVVALTPEQVAAWLKVWSAQKVKEAESLSSQAQAAKRNLYFDGRGDPRIPPQTEQELSQFFQAGLDVQRLLGRAIEARKFADALSRTAHP